jgi:exopolysaccharide biosynthesis polyprenyl glycosylphosphotransferase
MIREQERYFSPIIYLLDCIFILLSFAISVPLCVKIMGIIQPLLKGFGIDTVFFFYWDRYITILPFLFMIFVFFYQFWYRRRILQLRMVRTMMVQIAIPCFLTGVIFVVFAIMNRSAGADFLFIFLFLFISWLLLLGNRLLVLIYVRYEQKKGNFIKYVLLVGTGERARKAARLFDGNPGWGLQLIGFLTSEKSEVNTIISNYKVIGAVEDLPHILENTVVDTIFFTGGTDSTTQIRQLAHRCEMIGIDFVLDVSSLLQKSMGVSAEPVQDMSTILFRPLPYNPEKLFVKRFIDVLVSGIMIILCTPAWIIIPVLIRRDSPGGAFYVQRRVGTHGRPFNMYKFRTMVEDADKMQQDLMHLNEMDGPVFKIKDDPRLTRPGKFLRRTSLDELPQLFNVFIGNMSLVGPRPPVMKEVLQYRLWQRKRLSVKQGVTCLWQVTGRNEIKFNEWMQLDLQYVENWSLTLDFKILFMTIKAVISRRGAE